MCRHMYRWKRLPLECFGGKGNPSVSVNIEDFLTGEFEDRSRRGVFLCATSQTPARFHLHPAVTWASHSRQLYLQASSCPAGTFTKQ